MNSRTCTCGPVPCGQVRQYCGGYLLNKKQGFLPSILFSYKQNGLNNADVGAQLLFIWSFWRTKEVQKGPVSPPILTLLSRLFQLWAAKHVNRIAGTMSFLSHQEGRCDRCPSCETCVETCPHIARCPEAGRASAFAQSTDELEL